MKLKLKDIKTLRVLNISNTVNDRYSVTLMYDDRYESRFIKKENENEIFLGEAISMRFDSDFSYKGPPIKQDVDELNFLLSLCESEVKILKRENS